MQAILFKDYSCAPEGHTTMHFKSGDVLTGRAADMAIADGAAFTPVEETKIEAPIERKKRVRK
jgi:hypothetical protein